MILQSSTVSVFERMLVIALEHAGEQERVVLVADDENGVVRLVGGHAQLSLGLPHRDANHCFVV